jgi:hypothetical protein
VNTVINSQNMGATELLFASHKGVCFSFTSVATTLTLYFMPLVLFFALLYYTSKGMTCRHCIAIIHVQKNMP